MSDARELIVKLLSSIGGRKEVDQYLKHYCNGDAARYAVVEITPAVIAEQLAPLAASLSFLQRVGLSPVAVLRAPAPDLVARLRTSGCSAHELVVGQLDDDRAAVRKLLAAGALPVIVHDEGDDLADFADALTSELAPHKLIVLTPRGGWCDDDGSRIAAINLAADDERVRRLPDGERASLERFARLLARLPADASVSITSPDHLARELFTHRGAGTLVRRGERVMMYESFAQVDVVKLRDLLESCFGRRLKPSYFEDKACYRVYVAEDYRATAILTREGGVPYLDKFAVTGKAQGEGLGATLWQRLRADNHTLFWRAQASNAVNGWYFQQADGSYKSDRWIVFWYGMSDFDEIGRCVKRALELPESLKDHGTEDD